MAHQLIKAGFSTLDVAALGPATVRNMIDNFGYQQELHEEAVLVGFPMPAIQRETVMPGGFTFVQGPGTIGFDPIAPFTIPGPTASTTNWPELIRTGIDIALGRDPRVAVSTLQEPVEGGLMRPQTTQMQDPNVMPQLISRTGGRTPFIRMPNGLPGCPTGYHPEKAGKPYCVRNRRMNPLNPRALSRATRRVGGFARAVKRARTLKRICRTL